MLKFKDLGLLDVDEEQKIWRTSKRQIKSIKEM